MFFNLHFQMHSNVSVYLFFERAQLDYSIYRTSNKCDTPEMKAFSQGSGTQDVMLSTKNYKQFQCV